MVQYRKLLAFVLTLVAFSTVGFFSYFPLDSDPEQQPITLNPSEPPKNTEIKDSLAQLTQLEQQRNQGNSEVSLPSPDSKGASIRVFGNVTTELGETLSAQMIEFYSSSLQQHYTTRSGVDGGFVVELSPATDYQVSISPRGMYKPYLQSSIVLTEDRVVHNISLQAFPMGILRGFVVDSFDQPVVGLDLSVRTLEKEYSSANLLTDAAGSFVVENFPIGKFQVSSGTEEFFTSIGLNFDPDDVTGIRIKIDRGPYSLSGHIYVDSGQTIDGAHVVLNWIDQGDDITSRTSRLITVDAGGIFRFHGLGAGEHELIISAWKSGAFTQTIKKSVNLGVDPSDLNIVLDPY